MSGGPYRTPVLRVPAPVSVPVIRVPVPTMPAVVRSQVAGAIGPAGGKGDQGPPGPAGDYGYIRYGEMAGTAVRQIAAGVEAPFAVQAPQVVTGNLTGPFTGFDFLDGSSVLRARKAGDAYFINVRFSAIPSLFGGWIRISINVVGNISGLAGPTSTRTIPLEGAAGSMTRVDEPFEVFPQAGFLANGATVTIFASVPIDVSDEVLFVTPKVAAP